MTPIASIFVNKQRRSASLKTFEIIRNRRHFPSNMSICRLYSILQMLTIPGVIGRFGSKRCQKSVQLWTRYFIQIFFKNILLHMNCVRSKIRCSRFSLFLFRRTLANTIYYRPYSKPSSICWIDFI